MDGTESAWSDKTVFSDDVERDVEYELEQVTNELADNLDKMEDVLDKSNRLLSEYDTVLENLFQLPFMCLNLKNGRVC